MEGCHTWNLFLWNFLSWAESLINSQEEIPENEFPQKEIGWLPLGFSLHALSAEQPAMKENEGNK